MINVCLLLHHHYSSDPRARRYADALIAAGVHVDVVSLREPDHVLARYARVDRLRFYTIPMDHGSDNRGHYLLEYMVALILFTARLLVLYVKHRYKIIQVHNIPDFLIFAALIPRLCGAKIMLDIRDPMPEFYLSKRAEQLPNSMPMRLLRAQEKLSAALAHAVITANASFKANLVGRGIPASKITVVNNAPDPTLFDRARYQIQPPSDDRPFTLIYPGTIAKRYGLDVAIRALPDLMREIPRLRLLIIGHMSQDARDLAELARQLGVLEYVQFEPSIPIDDLPQRLLQADIGIYTALPDPHMSIATPTKVIEYAAMGLPIVASRLDVLENLFDDTSILVFEPGRADQFARCVLDLYDNPALRAELVRRASRICSERYRWNDERRAYYAVINQLLAPMSGHPAIGQKDDGSMTEMT